MKLSQKNLILLKMLHGDSGKWWYPPDFMTSDAFVGYEASARLSELASDYPEIIESKREGRFTYRRIKFEDTMAWRRLLPAPVRQAWIPF